MSVDELAARRRAKQSPGPNFQVVLVLVLIAVTLGVALLSSAWDTHSTDGACYITSKQNGKLVCPGDRR
jgi:hypothetical protein